MGKRTLLVFIMFTFLSFAHAQVGSSLFGFEGRVYLEEDKGKKVNISLYENNIKVSSYHTNYTGKFVLDIERNKHYTVIYEKEGYLAKSIIIKTHAKPNEAANVEVFKFDVILDKKESGVNYSQFDFPVTMIEFKKLLGQFDYNKEYTANMLIFHNKLLEKKINLAENK